MTAREIETEISIVALSTSGSSKFWSNNRSKSRISYLLQTYLNLISGPLKSFKN